MKEGKRIENKKEVKKERKDYTKLIKNIKLVMFLVMLLLIYFVSPRLTQLIKEGANYIYLLDNNIITRIVELVLAVALAIIVTFKRK